MEVRNAKESDTKKILEICKGVEEFQVDPKIEESWSREQIKNWIKSKDDVILIVEEDNKLIGFALFAHHIPTNKATLENIWVDKDYRRKGIPDKLIKEGLKQLRLKGVTYLCALVKIDNIASIKSLKKSGFQRGYDFTWVHMEI